MSGWPSLRQARQALQPPKRREFLFFYVHLAGDQRPQITVNMLAYFGRLQDRRKNRDSLFRMSELWHHGLLESKQRPF